MLRKKKSPRRRKGAKRVTLLLKGTTSETTRQQSGSFILITIRPDRFKKTCQVFSNLRSFNPSHNELITRLAYCHCRNSHRNRENNNRLPAGSNRQMV